MSRHEIVTYVTQFFDKAAGQTEVSMTTEVPGTSGGLSCRNVQSRLSFDFKGKAGKVRIGDDVEFIRDDGTRRVVVKRNGREIVSSDQYCAFTID